MGIFIIVLLALFTVGPIIIFHKNHKFEYENAWGIIFPFAAFAFYGYCLLNRQYETETGYYFLIVLLILSIYSSIVSLIMYAQYHNEKRKSDQCPYCKKLIEKDSSFCSYCGAKIEKAPGN